MDSHAYSLKDQSLNRWCLDSIAHPSPERLQYVFSYKPWMVRDNVGNVIDLMREMTITPIDPQNETPLTPLTPPPSPPRSNTPEEVEVPNLALKSEIEFGVSIYFARGCAPYVCTKCAEGIYARGSTLHTFLVDLLNGAYSRDFEEIFALYFLRELSQKKVRKSINGILCALVPHYTAAIMREKTYVPNMLEIDAAIAADYRATPEPKTMRGVLAYAYMRRIIHK
jgi:hypothetical protein